MFSLQTTSRLIRKASESAFGASQKFGGLSFHLHVTLFLFIGVCLVGENALLAERKRVDQKRRECLLKSVVIDFFDFFLVDFCEGLGLIIIAWGLILGLVGKEESSLREGQVV